MPEYIEREKALQLLNKNSITKKITLADGVSIYDTIKNMPTADVVEVVRCCDCEHKQENPDINNTCYLTCNLKYGIGGTIDPTDFCSYGKRKEVKNA